MPQHRTGQSTQAHPPRREENLTHQPANAEDSENLHHLHPRATSPHNSPPSPKPKLLHPLPLPPPNPQHRPVPRDPLPHNGSHRNRLPRPRASPQIHSGKVRLLGRVQTLDLRSPNGPPLRSRLPRNIRLRSPRSSLHRLQIRLLRRRTGPENQRNSISHGSHRQHRSSPTLPSRIRGCTPGRHFDYPGPVQLFPGRGRNQPLPRRLQHAPHIHPRRAKSLHMGQENLGPTHHPTLDSRIHNPPNAPLANLSTTAEHCGQKTYTAAHTSHKQPRSPGPAQPLQQSPRRNCTLETPDSHPTKLNSGARPLPG